MRPTILRCASMALALWLSGPAMPAQDSKPAVPDFGAEYDRLVADQRAAQRAFLAEVQKTYEAAARKAEEEARAAASRPTDADGAAMPGMTAAAAVIGPGMANDPTASFVPRFEDLAKRAKGTDAAVRALSWLLANGRDDAGMIPMSGPATPKAGSESASERAQKELLAAYLTSAALEEACATLRSVRAEAALRRIREASPHRNVKAAATANLAFLLCEDDGMDYRQDATGEYKPVERYLAGVLLKRKAEGRELMLSMRSDYADTPAMPPVTAYLFELEHLTVGMVAPDFTATDVEGKEFRLSDYRGKVVMLDFWGFW